MNRGILDTGVLISGDEGSIGPVELAISVISLAELQFGLLVTADRDVRAHRLQQLTRVQRSFDVLPVDEAVAESYARLAVSVLAIGRQPRARSFDLLIAATAHAHDATLYTRNADDFRGLDRLVDVVAV